MLGDHIRGFFILNIFLLKSTGRLTVSPKLECSCTMLKQDTTVIQLTPEKARKH